MKSVTIILIFVMALVYTARSQPFHFKNDPAFKRENYEGLKLIDQNKLTGFDFQLRVYCLYDKLNLLLITHKNGVWSNDLYKFSQGPGPHQINSVDSSNVDIKNYDHLVEELKKDSLFTLTTLDDSKVYKMAQQRGTADKGGILFADGAPYAIEILSPAAKRGFRANRPITTYKYYRLAELKSTAAIFQKLGDLMQIKLQ